MKPTLVYSVYCMLFFNALYFAYRDILAKTFSDSFIYTQKFEKSVQSVLENISQTDH